MNSNHDYPTNSSDVDSLLKNKWVVGICYVTIGGIIASFVWAFYVAVLAITH